MIKAERQEKIKCLIDERGSVSVRDIADGLGVSEMTIRRDLEEMAQSEMLVRVHGGARRLSPREATMLPREFTHSEKRALHADEKRVIARRAVSFIEEGQTLFLGTGTTVEQMVPLLPPCRLRIVTNSLSVFNLLVPREGCDLCMVGGTFRKSTGAFVGPAAEKMIASLGTDIAFVGANGVQGNSVSTSNMEEGRIQQLAFDMTDRRILLADSSKFGRRDFFTFYSVSDLDAVVCEKGLDDGLAHDVEGYTNLIIA